MYVSSLYSGEVTYIMRASKEFHIWDFPDSMYVLLESSANKMFFQIMYNHFESRRQYSKFLNLDPSTVRNYDKQTATNRKKKYIQCTPIWVLKKSKQFLTKKQIKIIETNISTYQLKAGKSIKKHILPIKECPALYRLLGHMIGDGSATRQKQPYYSNTCKELRDEFKQDLAIFGDVEIKDRQLGIPIVVFQKAITDFLASIFNISFDNKDHIPLLVFSAPDNCKRAFLRALFDDEGCVSVAVGIRITGKQMAMDIARLFEIFSIHTAIYETIRPQKKPIYTINILGKSIELFSKIINSNHPKKKDKLQLRIKRLHRTSRYRPKKVINNKILELLRKHQQAKTIDIANYIQLSLSHCLSYLNKLEKDGKIKYKIEKGKKRWFKA
jgi:intein/homing endonuclease